jgi:hypothetical protein
VECRLRARGVVFCPLIEDKVGYLNQDLGGNVNISHGNPSMGAGHKLHHLRSSRYGERENEIKYSNGKVVEIDKVGMQT